MKLSDYIQKLIPQDKMAHFIAGVIIFAMVFAILFFTKGDNLSNACVSLIVALGVGVAKEYLVDGVVDYLDIITTFLGGLFMFFYTLLFIL